MTKTKYWVALFLALAMVLTAMVPGVVSASTTYGPAVARSAALLVGKPYELGANGPSRFDASGYVMHVFGLHGATLPRTVAEQWTVGTAVARRADLRAGDIVLLEHGKTRWTSIYIGNSEIAWASSSAGKVVKKNITDRAVSELLVGARRLPDSAFSAPRPAPLPDKASIIVATAERYLGTPYVFGATGPKSFDCSGFTQFVFAQHNISIRRNSIGQSSAGIKVAKSQMKKGDILIFVNTYRSGISHVGIYIGGDRFIHAVPKTGVSYGNLSSSYWSSRLHSARRVIQ